MAWYLLLLLYRLLPLTHQLQRESHLFMTLSSYHQIQVHVTKGIFFSVQLYMNIEPVNILQPLVCISAAFFVHDIIIFKTGTKFCQNSAFKNWLSPWFWQRSCYNHVHSIFGSPQTPLQCVVNTLPLHWALKTHPHVSSKTKLPQHRFSWSSMLITITVHVHYGFQAYTELIWFDVNMAFLID